MIPHPFCLGGCIKCSAGQRAALFKQGLLQPGVAYDRMHLGGSLMIEIAAADLGRRFVACRQPRLRDRIERQIVRSACAGHPRRNPVGLDRMDENIRPAPRDAEGEQHVVQLAVRIGLRVVPAATRPLRIVEMAIAAGCKPELR